MIYNSWLKRNGLIRKGIFLINLICFFNINLDNTTIKNILIGKQIAMDL